MGVALRPQSLSDGGVGIVTDIADRVGIGLGVALARAGVPTQGHHWGDVVNRDGDLLAVGVDRAVRVLNGAVTLLVAGHRKWHWNVPFRKSSDSLMPSAPQPVVTVWVSRPGSVTA